MDSGHTELLKALNGYTDHSKSEVARVRRNMGELSADDLASLIWKAEDQIECMEAAVAANVAFLGKIAEVVRSHAIPQDDLTKHALELHAGLPVQSLLQTFVREWTAEGSSERQECFELLLGAMDRHVSSASGHRAAGSAPPTRVLCPESNLGRLMFEVRARGHAVEGCESRGLSYFGSEFLRLRCAQANEHTIQPFVLNTCNRFKQKDHLRSTPVPDVPVPEGSLPQTRWGDVICLYSSTDYCGSFDVVLGAYALAGTTNYFRYIRMMAYIVREGGLWANFGPIASHTDHDECHSRGVELSWEELRFAIGVFFEIKHESFVDAMHAQNRDSMMQIQHSCIYFEAVRNAAPVSGIGVAQ